jgi:peptidyl-prolyl cis-trans isomerase C
MNKKFILALLVTVGVTSAYVTYNKKLKKEAITTVTAESATKDATTTTELLDNDQNKLNASTNDKILARVDGVDFTKEQLAEKIKSRFNADLDKVDENTRNELIKATILSDVIYKEAKNSDIAKSPEFKTELAEKSKHLENTLYIENLIKKNVTEASVKEGYDKLVKETSDKEEVKAQHILVETEEEAKLVESKLAKGESFEALAKEYSKDGSKNNGGDLGYFAKGAMVKAFEDAAFALNIGQISSPIKSDFGYHIIKLNDKRKATPPTFEEAKASIEHGLAKKFIDGYFDKLLKDAKFELVK